MQVKNESKKSWRSKHTRTEEKGLMIATGTIAWCLRFGLSKNGQRNIKSKSLSGI